MSTPASDEKTEAYWLEQRKYVFGSLQMPFFLPAHTANCVIVRRVA